MSTAPARTDVDATWLTARIAECLNVPSDEIAADVPLVRYGLDSVAAAQLTAAIAAELGRDVPDWLLLDHPDIASLTQYIAGSGPAPAALSVLDRMRSDSVLPDDVRAVGQVWKPAPRAALVTGATGFLGAYLVRALLRDPIARVYCLLRPDYRGDPLDHLRRNLETYGIWEEAFARRIRAIPGDLLRPGLGLSPRDLGALCREIDAIYHCAAAVNWSAPYERLRDVNVFGTVEMLRLACRHGPKPFHFVSTLGVCYSTAGPETVCEPDDLTPLWGGVHLGYAQSKCVAEAVVRQAHERGLPAAIYRPALIAGDSRSGVSKADDLLALVIRGCVHMRAAPDLDWALDCCSVDHVADAIVALSRRPAGPLNVFHLTNPAARHWRELVLWMNLFGYPVRLVPYAEWLGRLEAEARALDHPLHSLLPFFLARPAGAGGMTLPELYQEGVRSRACGAQTRRALSRLALECPPLDARFLDRCFRSFIERGLLPPVAVSRQVPRAASPRLDAEFFAGLLRRFYGDPSLHVREATAVSVAAEHSILTELTSWRHGTAAGLSCYRLALQGGPAVPSELDVFVKVKAEDEEVLEVGERVAELCGDEVGAAFARFGHHTDIAGSHVREIGVYRQADERFRRHAPLIFGSVQDEDRRRWLLVLERLPDVLFASGADGTWTRPQIEAALEGIAEVHAIWYGREAELLAQPWLGPVLSAPQRTDTEELWAALAGHAAPYFSAWLGSDVRPLQREVIGGVGRWWRALEEMPRTLIHNDFNPRNAVLRPPGGPGGGCLCAFDWELATLGVPQHDLAEFLCFTMTPECHREEVSHYLEVHRAALARAAGRGIDAAGWREGFRLSLCDLFVNRLAMYCLLHAFRRQPFLGRVVRTWRMLSELME
jgi:thioester reductase-like protein